MSDGPLRVMTWNLWWRFGPWEQRHPAIVETIRHAAPDVVCLQEVWATEESDQLDVLGGALGMFTIRDDPVFHGGLAFGNAVMSRWPLERIGFVRLPNREGEPGHRSVVAASVDTPWGMWPVASAHLDHRFDASATRSLQMRRLMELGAAWRGNHERDLPLILGIDVNAVPDSDEVRMATGRRPGVEGIVFSDSWEQVGQGPGHTWRRGNPYVADSAWPDRRIDYLLVSWPRPKPVGNPVRIERAGIAPVDVDGVPVVPSDHAALGGAFVVPLSGSA